MSKIRIAIKEVDVGGEVEYFVRVESGDGRHSFNVWGTEVEIVDGREGDPATGEVRT